MAKAVYVKPEAIVIAAIEKTGLMAMSHTDQISGTLYPGDNEERVDFNWGGNGSSNDKGKDDNGDFWGD